MAALFISIRAIARARRVPLALVRLAALAGFFALWFYAGWGWGYDRAPLQTRVRYDESRLASGAVDALRTETIAQMNAVAPLAHALHEDSGLDTDALRRAWLPVVQRLGDSWTPRVLPAKPALAGFFMNTNGTSGFTNPFTLETQLAPDLLWFERPFAQAHEWSHVAGFNREDEANYIAALTCLRDPDPIARYSGWLELFTYLPQLRRYPHSVFVSEVWQDFTAIRARNARFVKPALAHVSWNAYNRYLKSNRIAAGVASYSEVTRLMAAIPLDRSGLPETKP